MSQSYVSDEEPKDLKQLYNEVDKEIDWPEGTYGGLLRSDQYSDIIRKLRSKIKQRSLQEGLSTDEYENRLWSMLSFVDRLRDALNPPRGDDPYKSVRGIWEHQNTDLIVGWTEEKYRPNIDRGELLVVVATYLSHPWLQLDIIDFILIDSLIFIELLAYSKSIYTGKEFGKINWAYKLAKQNPEKATMLRALMDMAAFVARYILPAGVLLLIYMFCSEKTTIIAGGIYLAYLTFYLLRWPIRHKRNKALRKDVDEHTERLRRMIEAYFYCKPPVISLSSLGKYLDRATESRPVFEGALFSLINRVQSEKGETFTPFIPNEAEA